MSKDVNMSYVTQLKSLSSYNRWADETIVATADPLSDEALETQGADGRSIRATLAHAVGTQLWWLGNWTGVRPPPYEQTRAGLHQAFADAHARIDVLVASTDDLGWERPVEFSFPGRPALHLPTWQTFVQVMYHGTQHRAQVAEALSRVGHSPGDMDYILWLLR
jgi:uncharacterized damage-inducible protein DinB